jgi:hypothetical protein
VYLGQGHGLFCGPGWGQCWSRGCEDWDKNTLGGLTAQDFPHLLLGNATSTPHLFL